MSNIVAQNQLTREQLEIIKSTVAKNASDEELKLFLYRCKAMDLDPLKPGQIYFVKYGGGPGSIVVGIDGFRSKASRTGKLAGIKRGVMRDEAGNCLGGWCEVYRSDWQHPAREEVPMNEYNTGKGQWQKMPETMIKKVAEAAALRMAFPDDLGGIYETSEMDQAAQARPVKPVNERTVVDQLEAPKEAPAPQEDLTSPWDYVVKAGKKYFGMKLKDMRDKEISDFVEWIEDKADERFRESEPAQEFLFFAKAALNEGRK